MGVPFVDGLAGFTFAPDGRKPGTHRCDRGWLNAVAGIAGGPSAVGRPEHVAVPGLAGGRERRPVAPNVPAR